MATLLTLYGVNFLALADFSIAPDRLTLKGVSLLCFEFFFPPPVHAFLHSFLFCSAIFRNALVLG